MEKLRRTSGVLLHITSLPSDISLGTFSCEATKFIDFLDAGGFGCWQVLPINDLGFGMSPYSACSSFAINPYLIDLTQLLTAEELSVFNFDKNNPWHEECVKKDSALDLVYKKYLKSYDKSSFEKDNKYWLDDYALYKAIKNKYKVSWVEWPEGLKNRNKLALDEFKLKNSYEIDKIKFIQYIASQQWNSIKKYAKSKGIEIFGDVPFYVELDSSDVWANPKDWQIENGKALLVGGTPPDFFNENGQLWGNPIYNYANMQKNKYTFWVNRFKRASDLYDIVRIDHFVAMHKYWAIKGSDKTAKNGKWVKGAGSELLKAITSKCKIKIVAEDLGVISDGMYALREKFGIPGLKILQYAFDGDGDNMNRPHNYEKNAVAYIGTHDNDTFMGLLSDGNWDRINRFKRYFGIPLEWGNDAVVDNAILSLYRSSANMVILTMQDILKLGSEAKMNVPGTTEGNWLWQLDQIPNFDVVSTIRYWSDLYSRK